ncbi:SpoIIE family protein phosphatase [Dactylosporangium salmoneum]|uniref:PAS domain-containing protein n=1 Tax=Dactylosporangium salmoneum TaxID=53361 RepID=A0ABN3FRF5_9ACTN
MPEPLPDENAEDLYDSAPCGYLSLRPDGTIVRVNRTFLDWTGYGPGELTGRRIQEIYAGGSRIFHETHLAPLLHLQREVREIAAEFRRADGTRLDALINAQLRDGPPALMRMTVFDATDRRTYERELLAERRRAERNATRVRLLQDVVLRCAALERAEEIAGPIERVGAEAFAATRTRVFLLDETAAALRPLDGAGPLVSLDDPGPEAQAAGRLDVVEDAAAGGVRIVTPLVADVRVLGVVSFEFDGGGALDDGAIELMRTIGRQAGQALDRIRLLEETTRRAWQSGFLARLSRALSETAGYAGRARRLVELLVPEVAAYAQIDLEEAGARASAPEGADGWTVPTDVLAAVHAAGRAGRLTGVPLMATDGRRAMVLPLRARNAVIGTLLLTAAEQDAPGRAGRADVGPDFLADLADRAGLSLDNARLSERDREVADTLQRSLLSGTWPQDPRYRVATEYRPAVHTLEVGGDWYDVFATSAESVGIVVGDVVGRGLHAASAMGQLRSAVRALATAQDGPAAVLRHMDEFVASFAAGQMTTVAYAELSLDSGELRYACAGHLPPLLVEPGGVPTYLWEARSGPLGATAGGRARAEAALTVPRGSRLLLYTDGLVERRGEQLQRRLDRLAELAAEHWQTPLSALAGRLSDAMLPDGGGHDDMCLLALDFADAPPFRAEVPARMSELAGLRAALDRWLATQGVGDYDRFGIVLATAEAVANAIEHGYDFDEGRAVGVLAQVDGDAVAVRVADSGQWRPPRSALQRGRGLALIGRLMTNLVIDRGVGTTVLMRRTVSPGRLGV